MTEDIRNEDVKNEEKAGSDLMDKFGDLMDAFIEEADLYMVIHFPEGSSVLEIKSSVGSSVVDLYFLLRAFPAVWEAMEKEMPLTDDPDEIKELVDSILELIKGTMYDGVIGETADD